VPTNRGHIRTSAAIQESARLLRKHLTPAEQALWSRLRDRQLAGIKFRRQHPLGPFVADFYCAESRLVVELDGGVHDQMQERDANRTVEFEQRGYRVIRFSNARVLHEIEQVLEEIRVACEEGKR